MYLFIITISEAQTITNEPPIVTATGDQIYCPLTQIPIATSLTITDVDNTEIEALYIQISTGYIEGEDQLLLIGNHPNVNSSWNNRDGKITLSSSSPGNLVSYIDLVAAARNVVFESSSPSPSGEKSFSITIGDANYLPSTEHYYEYVSNVGITWDAAKIAAEGRTYYGLQGYLATISSAEEAQLSGEQTKGSGWIGGSDAASEGTWRWVTGPENGTIFWNGTPSGSSPNYANWNIGEPNQAGDEDYAHITDPSSGNRGTWNDISNTGAPNGIYQPKGYIVEYGGMPGDPVLNISASTKISILTINGISGTERCGNGSLILQSQVSTGIVHWYDAPENGTLLYTGNNYTTPFLNATTTYYAYVSYNGCSTGTRTPIEAIIKPLPIISPTIDFLNCDEDGIADGYTDFNLLETEDQITNGDNSFDITYHLSILDAENNTNPIPASPYNNNTSNTVYARVENTLGCHLISTINLSVSTTSFPNDYMYVLDTCDTDTQDGLYTIDLSLATSGILNQFPANQNLSVHYYKSLDNATLEENEITNLNYINETAYQQIIYVRVESDDNGACFGIGPHLTLNIYPEPVFDLDEITYLCTGASVVLHTYNPQENYTYEWTNENNEIIGNTASVEVYTPGIYTALGTSTDGCTSKPKHINVVTSHPANISLNDINISDKSADNTIIINNQNNNLGLGDYEFSLNIPFGNFQDNPIFENVAPGLHTLYIRDKNGCGATQIEIGVIGYLRFLTPNNDGKNDTWQILGVTEDAYPQAELLIFDRYGKFITQINPLGNGWDGNYNNSPMTTSDYWFTLQLTDLNGQIHIRNGHFTLKR